MGKRTKNKRAAIEMSMGTIITIILAVVFLILGLTFVKSIFGVASSSIQITDDKLKAQLSTLFADENQPTFIKPEEGVFKVRAASDFYFVIGGRSKNGNDVQRGDLQYRFILDKNAPNSCLSKFNNNEARIKAWFPGVKFAADENEEVLNPLTIYQGDMSSSRIQISIPSGTPLCSQIILYDVFDKSDNSTSAVPVGGSSFTVQVLRRSIV